ncbi:MarR family transcriptional regulator [Altericroceibacterium spongiae]|uniref:MarR family transcriptional regulator n=1 Tax=Altericroceibacterium spongiae TaxID=2320269 RepID=A0A420EFA9_9SPHN|nr:MarR family transcriptional regulator [Altericroceibacterium spongiae]RKF19372.1 MarR family transcriptional regulator [Altericroceibacterium spongiae]
MTKVKGDDSLPWREMSRYDGPQSSPGFVLWHGFMRWQRHLNALLKPFGLTQPQFAVLATCGWLTRGGQEVTQQAMADFLDMDRMHISQIASRLERDGLLCRSPSVEDMRAKLVSLTPAGREKLAEVMPVAEAFDESFFAGAAPDRTSFRF